MTTFTQRVLGAALLEPSTYEEVEADSLATSQAVALVLLVGLAGGVGSLEFGRAQGAPGVVAAVIAALVGWVAWAMLTYLIGT